jgi:TonB family protein
MRNFERAALALAGMTMAGGAIASTPAVVRNEPMYFAYPADAFQQRLEGRVGVELQISAAGTVEDCKVVAGVAESLDSASCTYWRRTVFRAAYDEQGRPVASTLRKFSDWRLRN